jgi:uncharacterized membrane protein YgaE (UPF0421/DUF939 family)
MRSKRITMTRASRHRKNQQGGDILTITSVEHLNTLLDTNKIENVQVEFNRAYNDYTNAQTDIETYNLLKEYLNNKKKYNVYAIYNKEVVREESYIPTEKTFLEVIQDLIPFTSTSPPPLPKEICNVIHNEHELSVYHYLGRLQQVRVEFGEDTMTYTDINTNKITQVVISNYLQNKRDANIAVILYTDV